MAEERTTPPDRPRQGALVISLDFELFWGMLQASNLDKYGRNITGAREALPRILALFVEHGIHATFAAVGFLLFSNKEELLAEAPTLRPSYADQHLDNYGHLDHVGPNEEADPIHFGASMIEKIRQAPGQEVACHTFSHYYCLEAGQTLEQFEADLEASVQAARKRGIALKSMVFPGNQLSADHLEVIKRHGFTAFRGNQRSWVHQPVERRAFFTPTKRLFRLVDKWLPLTGPNCHPWPGPGTTPPVEIPASHFLGAWSRLTSGLDRLRLARVTKAMDHAARTGTIYHLWWHPHNFGRNLEENMAFLERIIDHFRRLRETYGMESLSMGEVADKVLGHG